MSEQAHKILGRYQLLVAVARGGMGQVWLGRLKGARGFSKLVAVKTLLPDQSEHDRLEAMLAEEARLASLIQHPNVVRTMELGEHEGMLYLVMEWVDGEPLGFVLERAKQRGGMPLGVAVALASQVLAGLHAAHELTDESGPLGVVHRDVSPHNILVTYDGVAKLLDFGIAKATHQTSSNTATGEIKGKFSYMAPEQILGAEVDRRCDVFAAGIVLYLLATGHHPFKHHNTAAVIHAITTDDPVAPPSTLTEDFPPELERVLLKALEKDVENRWASAEEMRVALEQAMPQAFGDAGRAQLLAFMEQAVGDRKAARREAVRRAQLAADRSDVDSGARAALQASAQSASSLRAISISQPAPAESEPPELIVAEAGAFTQLAPSRKPRPKAPWIAAAAGVLMALGAVLPRLGAPERASGSNSAGVEAGSAMSAPRPLPRVEPPVVVPPAQAPSDPVTTPSPAPSSSVAVNPTPKAASARTPPRSVRPANAPPTSKPKPSSNDDLLAPDYAR
ncbi:MAG TPA: protein kinase [Polyangiaceae bacterium]|nr:protein kinase [Polyangiaceae bacterium]